jgi:predicted ATPase
MSEQSFSTVNFSFQNFRVFENQCDFDFKPISFLIGPNSSGKSSLMKLLKTINQSSKKNRNYFIPHRIESNSIDSNSIDIDLSSSLPKENDPFIFSMDLSHFFNGIKIKSDLIYFKSKNKNALSISGYKLFWHEILILQIEYLESGRYNIEMNYTALIQMAREILEKDVEIQQKNNELRDFSDAVFFDPEEQDYLKMIKEGNHLFESNLEQMSLFDHITKWQELFFKRTENLKVERVDSFFIDKNYYDDFGDNGLSGFFQYIFTLIKNNISNNYKEIYQINAEIKLSDLGKFYCDVLPQRIQKAQQEFLDKRIFFHHAPVFKSERTKIFDINSNNATPFDLIIRTYILQNRYSIKDSVLPSNDYIDYWLTKFDIGRTLVIKSIHPSNQYYTIEVLLSNDELISISDLGYGAGQVLSYIMLPFFGEVPFAHSNEIESYDLIEDELIKKDKSSERKIHFNHFDGITGNKIQTRNIYLEEPETNLHPNWQSKLAELFAFQISIGLRFVIETHSEYMIRKIQTMVAKNEFDNGDVVIYYFNHKKKLEQKDSTVTSEIRINKNGTLSQSFGPGFFDEAGRLSLELLSINSISKN